MSDNPATENSPQQNQSEEPTTQVATPSGTEGAEEPAAHTALGGEHEFAPFDIEKLEVDEEFAEALTEEDHEYLTDFASRYNLPHDAVQEMIDTYFSHLAGVRDSVGSSVDEAWSAMTGEWHSELEAQYGDKLNDVIARLQPVLNEFGTPQLREAMDITGMGNHPEMVRFLEKIADAIGEAPPVERGRPANGAASGLSAVYPTMNQG